MGFGRVGLGFRVTGEYDRCRKGLLCPWGLMGFQKRDIGFLQGSQGV